MVSYPLGTEVQVKKARLIGKILGVIPTQDGDRVKEYRVWIYKSNRVHCFRPEDLTTSY